MLSRLEFSYQVVLNYGVLRKGNKALEAFETHGSDRFSCFAIVFPMWSVVLLIIRKKSLYRSVAFNASVFSAFQKKTQ